MFNKDDIIYSYTRAQEIEDGVLIDVTGIAKQAGFKFPVAITQHLQGNLSHIAKSSFEDYNGRLWDVLTVLFYTIKQGRSKGSTIEFIVKFGGKNHKLWGICGPGDNAEPVITIMYPEDY